MEHQLILGVRRVNTYALNQRAHSAAGANRMIRSIKRLVADESAATAIEYALIASLIAVAIIVSITVLGTQLQNTFNEVSTNLK